MSGDLSNNPLVRNEQLVRSRNTKIKNGIKKFFKNKKEIKKEPIPFMCECSEADCEKHVKISIDEYDKTHKRKDRFTIAKGHKTPAVEKVVTEKTEFHIVEKHRLRP